MRFRANRIVVGAVVVAGLVALAAAYGLARLRGTPAHAGANPFRLPSSPVMAFRLKGEYFGDLSDANVAAARPLDGGRLETSIRDVLADPGTYTDTRVRCFEPGLGFRFGSGKNAVDVSICLKCRKVRFARGDDGSARGLTPEGTRSLTAIYRELFGSDRLLPETEGATVSGGS